MLERAFEFEDLESSGQTVVPSTDIQSQNNDNHRPRLIVCSKADNLACQLIGLLLHTQSARDALTDVGILCDVCEPTDPLLTKEGSGVLIIQSYPRVPHSRLFRPYAPKSVLPSHVKDGNPQWRILVHDCKEMSSDSRQQNFISQLISWFGKKEWKLSETELPWGPIRRQNNHRARDHANRREEERQRRHGPGYYRGWYGSGKLT